MPTTSKSVLKTFAVHEVEPAIKPLPTCKTYEAIPALIGSKVESCCDFTADCIRNVHFQPLLVAAHFAFSQHRPLVLSPDMIWVTIAQGLAQHIKNHAEKLRDKFVGHNGKLDITVERNDLVKGSPENPWDQVIGEFSGAIRKHLRTTYDQLISDFSTTGPVERTACEVVLLDAFQPYFEYRLVCICGIPEITLEGTTQDWQRLREKVDRLQPYDLDWWLPNVRQIADQFVRASEGDVDVKFWRDIYKREQAYGADKINGWLVQLVPYLKNHQTGNFTVRNRLLETPEEWSVSTGCLPSGIAQVPFRWQFESTEIAMEFLGGFVGITQNTDTMALRPKLGWAVRQASDVDQVLLRLKKYQATPPLEAPAFDLCWQRLDLDAICEIPGDLVCFYKFCNGVTLKGKDDSDAVSFRRLEDVEVITNPAAHGSSSNENEGPSESVIAIARGQWLRFGDFADGSIVAIELMHSGSGWKVIKCGADEHSPSVIASSFAEFVEHTLKRLVEG